MTPSTQQSCHSFGSITVYVPVPFSAELSSFSLAQNMPGICFLLPTRRFKCHPTPHSCCHHPTTKQPKHTDFLPPLKSFTTIKTLGRFGMAESDMFGAGLDPFFPLGCNKGFILNLDTVQHSFWLEVGRGASTSHYENRRVHSA